ncbi:MAG: cyclic nucleotide-binding domain-containing protein [Ignavibacteria bacterium]|nr:cyclic nucleotide-binding domain-containing protein [Ignavibacteria bacterium]
MENENLKVRSSLWSNIFKLESDEEKILDLLRNFPAFAELKRKELKMIRKLVQVREYLPNEIIFYEGDPGVSMFIIESGKVEIYHTFKSGIKQELALLFAGDFMGEFSVIVEGNRMATARALTETRLLIIFRPDLLELIQREPSLGVKILLGFSKIFVDKLRNLNKDYLNLYELLHYEKQLDK